MGRLINVLTDEERAVKVRISVLEEKEKELISRICLLDLKVKGMKPEIIKKVLHNPMTVEQGKMEMHKLLTASRRIQGDNY